MKTDRLTELKKVKFERISEMYMNKLFMPIAILFYVLIMIFLFNVPFVTMGKFIAYTIILIVLPGVAILSLLDCRESWFTMSCLGYAVGYALNIGEYFLSEAFDRKISFECLSLVVGLVSIGIVLYKHLLCGERILKREENNDHISNKIFFILYLFANVFAYAANYLSTDVSGVSSISRDMQYWCNNSAALKIQFPAEILYMDGIPLFYHYFSSVQVAWFSSVSGIDIFTLSFPLFSLTKTFILIGAAIFMMDTLCENNGAKIVGMVLALCTTGFEDIVNVTFLQETFLMPFGFDIGFAYGCYFITLLVIQWKTKKLKFSLWILCSLCWAVCVGGKAPVASVLIVLPAMFCLYWLIKKEWRLSLAYGISIVGIFLVINVVCVGMFSVFRGNSTWTLNLYTMQEIKTLYLRGGYEVSLIAALIIKLFLVNPILSTGTAVSILLLVYLVKGKKISSDQIYLIAALLVCAGWGYTLWIMVKAIGHSEMYFAMAAFIPQYVLIAEMYMRRDEIKKRLARILIQYICCATMVISVALFLFCGHLKVGMVTAVHRGLKDLCFAELEQTNNWDKSTCIRRADVEALKWIRDNTDKDVLVLSDRAALTGDKAYYNYGMYCERQQYLEGTNMFFQLDEALQNEIDRRLAVIFSVFYNVDNAIQTVKEDGVDYIVQTKDISPNFEYNPEELQLMYSTDTINVYKVR